MLEKVTYTNHVNQTITLGDADYLLNRNNLHSHEWGYSTLDNKIVSFNRKVAKYTLPMTIVSDDPEAANELFEILEKDVATNSKGTLAVGDYSIQGYIYQSSGTNRRKPEYSFVSDELWRKEKTYMYRISNSPSTEEGLGFPYDYPYDYLSPIGMQNFNNTNYVDSDFIITFYGQISNPSIIIGGNTYKVNCDVYANEFLTINSKEKTIVKTTSRGEQINEFVNREKEAGYVFKKIPTGIVTVIMPSEFDVDVKIIEERSEPKWI